MTRAASDSWGRALADWAIPEQILAVAPVPPWVLPPEFFTVEHRTPSDQSPSVQLARAGLGAGGTLLDVGCGGGAASVPLAPLASRITGVDERRAMLANFALACSAAGVDHAEVDGRWPDIADGVEPADVVVCHHVVYNVADIAPFLLALTLHARRLVVVELTGSHPTSPFSPLWERFWGLRRPTEPTAQLFVEVVRELGFDPIEQSFVREPRQKGVARADYVAFARRRLCLTPDRDPEVDSALGESWPLSVSQLMAVAWAPSGAAPPVPSAG